MQRATATQIATSWASLFWIRALITKNLPVTSIKAGGQQRARLIVHKSGNLQRILFQNCGHHCFCLSWMELGVSQIWHIFLEVGFYRSDVSTQPTCFFSQIFRSLHFSPSCSVRSENVLANMITSHSLTNWREGVDGYNPNNDLLCTRMLNRCSASGFRW